MLQLKNVGCEFGGILSVNICMYCQKTASPGNIKHFITSEDNDFE